MEQLKEMKLGEDVYERIQDDDDGDDDLSNLLMKK